MVSIVRPSATVVDIPIDCHIVTAQTISSVLAAILDLLMFQRKQIPLVYQTFKFMVEKFQPLLDAVEDSGAWDDYLMEQARTEATTTLTNIKKLKRVSLLKVFIV